MVNTADNTIDQLTELIHIIARKYVSQFTNSHGQIDLKKKSGFSGKLPGSLGGNTFIDHDHDGTDGQGQQLSAENTHLDPLLGPAAGAIHWQQAAIQALIAAESIDPDTLMIDAGACHVAGSLTDLLDNIFCRLDGLETVIGGYGIGGYGETGYGE